MALTLKILKNPGKRTLHALPFFFTFANAVFGLASILKSAEGEIVTAAYCILGAILMDICDGRVARACGTSSSLGMELDSLCDAVSFCLAPVVLLLNWYGMNIWGYGASMIYLCAGLFRLAKFNALSQTLKPFFLACQQQALR